jgi:hypothetical protein
MTLFKINTPGLAVVPFESDTPGTISMDTIPFRQTMKAMEIKSRDM